MTNTVNKPARRFRRTTKEDSLTVKLTSEQKQRLLEYADTLELTMSYIVCKWIDDIPNPEELQSPDQINTEIDRISSIRTKL